MKTALSRLLFAISVCALLAMTGYGQATNVIGDLKRSFSRFDLVDLKVSSAQKQLVLTAEGTKYTINLTPHDIRAANFKAENTGVDGMTSVARADVSTFIGTIDGVSGSAARFGITAQGLEGFFQKGSDRFYVEPASVYSKDASSESYVVYREENALNNNGFSCGAALLDKIEHGKELTNVNRAAASAGSKTVTLATEADLSYVNTLGGVAAANAEILNILNTLEGIYQDQLNLKVRVSYQHTWTTSDPYSAASPQAATEAFRGYWNVNFPTSSYARDAAHLFTAQSTVQSQGWAYIGVICANPSYAYGVSGYIDWAPAKYLITTHELAHNLGASHCDNQANCANTLMNAQLSGDTALTFCPFSKNEVSSYVSASATCLRNGASCKFDFDGDSKADIGVFRPENGTWFIANSSGGFFGAQFGQNGDKTVPADYDGDGKTDMAVYRNGTWYRMMSSTNTFDGLSFGAATDVPAPADFDGDGKADVAVFRPSEGIWYELRSANNQFVAYNFGTAGDIPLPADYDGDGKADVNVFRPSNGTWYRANSSTGTFYGAQFGASTDKPLVGDFDGDGKADLAVFRPSTGTWYIMKADGTFSGTAFGMAGDVASPADFDGDGKADIAVYRPSQGVWFTMTGGGFQAYTFGASADKPVQAFYQQ